MKIIKPSYTILNKEDIKLAEIQIEHAARTCYKSHEWITKESACKLIERLMHAKHDAMLEFGPSITVGFICDRGISHELVRHRLCSFAQESTRYCNYTKDKFSNELTFIIPCWVKKEDDSAYLEWKSLMQTVELMYNRLIKMGWTPEKARSILPNSIKTEIVVKANIREWRHILELRTAPSAHPQMRELMVPLLTELADISPTLFADLSINAI